VRKMKAEAGDLLNKRGLRREIKPLILLAVEIAQTQRNRYE